MAIEGEKKYKGIQSTLTKKKKGAEIQDYLVGSILKMDGIERTAEEEDVTTLDSPDGEKETRQGDKKTSDIKVEIIYKKDNDIEAMKKMADLFDSGDQEDWEIKQPSGIKWEFKAHIKSIKEKEITTDGRMGFEFTLAVSGKPKLTKE